MSEGAIIIRHLGYKGIATEDILRALPEAVRIGDRIPVELDQSAVLARALETRDWVDAHRHALVEFERLVAPQLLAHPGFGIHYFGTASIPLMMFLGMKVGSWWAVDAYNHHHSRKDWTWDDPLAPAPSVNLDLDGLPKRPSIAAGDVVIRVAVSYPVDPMLTRAQVAQPLAEIDVGVEKPALDVLASPAGVEAVARCFRDALDAIQEKLPNAAMVHVFAAVPPGVAFRMGTWISQTMHACVQTYELERKGTTKGYYPAFVLQRPAPARLVATAEELATLDRERTIWQEELGHLQAMVASLKSNPQTWLEEIGAGSSDHVAPRWRSLPSPRELEGIDAKIDTAARQAPDGFKFDHVARAWQLDDSLLLPLLRRLPDEARRRRAARLFLFHESFHREQLLTSATSPGIGRFGKLLEEADFQADAWALLYNHHYEASTSKIDDVPASLREGVSVAIETMMAFDDAVGSTTEMQARRISRYLIWTWQLLELERCASFDECLARLCDKPIIELAGLRTHVAETRVICSLSPDHATDLEIAVLRDGRIRRFPQGQATRLDHALRGLREHSADLIRTSLNAVADVVIPARGA